MAYKFSLSSHKRLIGVDPDIIRVLHHALELGVIDFTVVCGVRTKEEQAALYAQGRTTPGNIVTWTLNSNHLINPETGFGEAVDLIPYPTGYDDHGAFFKLAWVIKAAAELEGVAMEWGYDKWGKDLAHFQISL